MTELASQDAELAEVRRQLETAHAAVEAERRTSNDCTARCEAVAAELDMMSITHGSLVSAHNETLKKNARLQEENKHWKTIVENSDEPLRMSPSAEAVDGTLRAANAELKQRIDELDASAAAFVVELRQRDDQIVRLEQEVLDARQEAGNERRRSRLASAGASFYNETHFS